MVKIEHAVIAGRQFKAAGLTPSALLSNKAIKEAVDWMNDEVLPIGFRPAPRVPVRGRPIVER